MSLSKQELGNIESEVTTSGIVATLNDEKSVRKLIIDDYQTIFNFTLACTVRFLEYVFPNQVGLAAQLTADLLAKKEAWKAADFINLYKWIRQNGEQLDLMGNQLNAIKFFEIVEKYEDHRCQALEDLHNKRKGIGQGTGRTHETTPFEKLQIKNVLKPVVGGKSDQTFFEK